MTSNVDVTVINGTLSEKEIQSYVELMQNKYPDRIYSKMTMSVVDDDNVDITAEYKTERFQRIRRITGYLVGTIDRFNNAKRAEVNDRVKHDVSTVTDFEDVYLDTAEGGA